MISITLLLAFQPDARPILFRYPADKTYQSVAVAGSFNGWDRGKNFLKLSGDRKNWETTLSLRPGSYQYKFVLDGTTWVTDPSKPEVDDGNGNKNSPLSVTPRGYEAPAKPGDAKITASALDHTSTSAYLNWDQGELTLRLRTRKGDVGRASLVDTKRQPVYMTAGPADEFYDTFETRIPWSKKSPLSYSFVLDKQPFGLKGLGSKLPFTVDPKTYVQNTPPTWVEDTIFYQIFPDRFANGSKSNDPTDLLPWNGNSSGRSAGGDAAGIMQKLGYLKDLGVNGIYLNPVMQGVDSHRYDPCDFYNVDMRFGTNEEFIQLVDKFHTNGIRVVLDQIFDHVGIKFKPFEDLLANQQESRYKEWFNVRKWPVKFEDNPNYEGWFGYKWMPKLKMTNPEVQKHLLDSVTHWMKRSKLSGWRMDVANEVPHDFWRLFRTHLKKIDPNAWSVGEVWTDARAWLGGDQWDASMNYPFRDVALRYIAEGTINGQQALNGLNNVYRLYPPQVSRNQLNLLDSHDTERFFTTCKGDSKLAELGAVLLFTFPGAPSIYYGSEIGMAGGPDPDNRHGMEWERVPGNPMLATHKKLIRLRLDTPALRRGTFEPVSAGGQGLVFRRTYQGKSVFVLVNRGDQAMQLVAPRDRTVLFGTATRTEKGWNVGPKSAVVLG